MLSIATASALLVSLVVAQRPQDGVTVINSSTIQGASISFKQTSVCETTEGVTAHAGYVRLPSTLFPFFETNETNAWTLNSFFWYVSARNDPENAPIAIYLAGGPGESSVHTSATESGPCLVNPDNNSTMLNPWSFNNHVNMLYIDQPNFAGFSYDEVTEGLLDLTTGDVIPGAGEANNSFVPGRWGSQQPSRTARTTRNTAKILWEVVQAFTADFPGVKDKSISAWGNSYGGAFAPAMLAHFQRQNEAIATGEIDATQYHPLQIDTLGITNGFLDMALQLFAYPEIANNNTFGVKLLPDEVYESAKANITKPGGCNDAFVQCRQLEFEGDPESLGLNETVNAACGSLLLQCFSEVEIPFMAVTGRSSFDIAYPLANPVPRVYAAGFFNQEWVQRDLGVPVNFTWVSNTVTNTMLATGDTARHNISDIEYLLESGIKVALIHGDRDYVCNWIGGEAVALAAQFSGSEAFRSAGYAVIATKDTYQGGVVKQSGGFSFSRVFQAGHSPHTYQPETTYEIFMRAMFNTDIATGKEALTDGYLSEGPGDAWGWTDTLPDPIENECNLWNPVGSCTEEQLAAVAEGSATVNEHFIVSSPGGLPVLAPQENGSSNADGGSTNGTSGDSPSGQSGGSSGGSGNGASKRLSGVGFVSVVVLLSTAFVAAV